MKTQPFWVLLMSATMMGAMVSDSVRTQKDLITVHIFNRINEAALKVNCYKYYLYNKDKYFYSEKYKSQFFDINANESAIFNIRPDSWGKINIDVPCSSDTCTWIYYWRSADNRLHLHKTGIKFMDAKSTVVDFIDEVDAMALVLKGNNLQESYIFYPGMIDSDQD